MCSETLIDQSTTGVRKICVRIYEYDVLMFQVMRYELVEDTITKGHVNRARAVVPFTPKYCQMFQRLVFSNTGRNDVLSFFHCIINVFTVCRGVECQFLYLVKKWKQTRCSFVIFQVFSWPFIVVALNVF